MSAKYSGSAPFSYRYQTDQERRLAQAERMIKTLSALIGDGGEVIGRAAVFATMDDVDINLLSLGSRIYVTDEDTSYLRHADGLKVIVTS